jgi:uncharacterized protein YndB with AHSA1/START domain
VSEFPTQDLVAPAGNVEFDGDHVTLRYERFLNHPPEVVWAAITEPEQLAAWLMTPAATIGGHAGGSIDMVTGPSSFHWTGTILTWDPPRVYEHEWNMEPRPEVPGGEATVVRWELAPSGEGTRLNVTHRRLTRSTGLGFAPGFHAFLDRLAAQLAGEPLPNWMKRYDEVRHAYPAWSMPG